MVSGLWDCVFHLRARSCGVSHDGIISTMIQKMKEEPTPSSDSTRMSPPDCWQISLLV